MPRRKSVRQQELEVENWNLKHPQIGIAVAVRKDNGNIEHTRTRSAAFMLSGHTAVITLEGVGCYLLDRVTEAAS